MPGTTAADLRVLNRRRPASRPRLVYLPQRSAIWAWVRKDEQEPGNQLAELRQLAPRRGLEVATESVLTGESAWKGDHREQLRQGLDDAAARPAPQICVSLSCRGRHQTDEHPSVLHRTVRCPGPLARSARAGAQSHGNELTSTLPGPTDGRESKLLDTPTSLGGGHPSSKY